MPTLELISHPLCPYVQRAAIALAEKGVPFRRTDIDLAAKPDWFLAISPLGKVPLLRVGAATVFESAVILEYLEDTVAPRLHPADPLRRAEHRSWIEFGSAVLGTVWGLYTAPDAEAFETKRAALAAQLDRIEARLVAAPWFDGADFSLVDAVFAPVFRYLDAFAAIGAFGLVDGKPKIARWRAALAARPSVAAAVTADYPQRLSAFLARQDSHLARLIADRDAGRPPQAAA